MLYLIPETVFEPEVLRLAIAANVSSRETADAVSAVFIKLGSLTLLFWNAEFEVIFEVSIVDTSGEVDEASAYFMGWFSPVLEIFWHRKYSSAIIQVSKDLYSQHWIEVNQTWIYSHRNDDSAELKAW